MLRVFITGAGITSPLGTGIDETADALRTNVRAIGPLTLFTPLNGSPLPVGQVTEKYHGDPPRTHRLALMAINEIRDSIKTAPDGIFIGTTTGGMATTEVHLRDLLKDPALYRFHSTGTVAETLAAELGCNGPILTVSTACSSSAVAIALAAAYLRRGLGRRVIAGGADSLCRLTYYGFNSLQLIDPQGARPMDRQRRGMSVAEGAAMLILEAAETPPPGALGELLGAGLTCDAYHPAAPRPDGAGARGAMELACRDAGLRPEDVSYINLHGTGTRDNDLAEATALRALFGGTPPPLSSSKGALGHTLGAAGAIEAVISLLAIREQLMPANTGFSEEDPELALVPVKEPAREKITAVLSNSFGFGGNNASLVITDGSTFMKRDDDAPSRRLAVIASSCLTGAGAIDATLERFRSGAPFHGTVPAEVISSLLSPKEARRMKRLQRLSMALAETIMKEPGASPVTSVYYGTGWGALTETSDFLEKLYESNEQFTSPTDFVGSVHNAPAGQLAIKYGASGKNITLTGGDHTFEQALLAATLTMDRGERAILAGVDEYHDRLNPLFTGEMSPCDGGGVLMAAIEGETGPFMELLFLRHGAADRSAADALASLLKQQAALGRYGAVFAGIPSHARGFATDMLRRILAEAGLSLPVVEYRAFTGEHAAATAVAAVLAARCVAQGTAPLEGKPHSLAGKGILIIGLGNDLSAIAVTP